jgi:hypothetical protein
MWDTLRWEIFCRESFLSIGIVTVAAAAEVCKPRGLLLTTALF